MARAPNHFQMPCPICQTKITFPIVYGETTPAQMLPGHVNLHMRLDKTLMREHIEKVHHTRPPQDGSASTTTDEERT